VVDAARPKEDVSEFVWQRLPPASPADIASRHERHHRSARGQPSAPDPPAAGPGSGRAAADRAYLSGRLHHAWLLAGPRGIGKATLAYRFARFLFSPSRSRRPSPRRRNSLDVAPEDPAAKLVAARSHPDLLVVQRAIDPRRPIKSGKDKIAQLKSSISVEDSRDASHFFSLSPAMGGWRVCIVDAADDLNADAANALLKVLEEPPARSVFVIVAHAPGRLLATIRSRCIRLDLKPLATGRWSRCWALAAAPRHFAGRACRHRRAVPGQPRPGAQSHRLARRAAVPQVPGRGTRPPPFARPACSRSPAT
jgi:hypothetical protein